MSEDRSPDRIVVKRLGGRVDAQLWLDGCPVEGHADSTGTLSVRSLVAPLIDRLEAARHAQDP